MPAFTPEHAVTVLNETVRLYPDLIVIEVGPAITIYNAQAKDNITTYYQMGGNLPFGNEFNLRSFPGGARYIANTGAVLWLDNNAGKAFQSGSSGVFVYDTPVRFAYNTYTGGGGRHSWDPFTVLWAITGNTWFNKQRGNMAVAASGANSWIAGSGEDYVAVHKNVSAVGAHLNEILGTRPSDVQSKRSGVNIVPILNLLLLGD